MNDTVFVTGGTGFLGRHLICRLRQQGRTVRVLVRQQRMSNDRRRDDLVALGAEIVEGDLLDRSSFESALDDVTHIFHLAGQLLVPGIPSDVYERLHVDGTRNLLEACGEISTLRSIVHCSTTGVLGPTGATPAGEDSPERPSNVYEQTKAAGEKIALRLAEQYRLPLMVVRPALVYGPGDLHLLGWFRAIKRGYYFVVGTGSNYLHPIYIDDLISGLMCCAEEPAATGRIYNLVGEQPVPIRDLAAAIAHALGTRLPPQHLPATLAWTLASMMEQLFAVDPARLPLTRSRTTFMTENRAYSGARACSELGFSPKVDLERGLRWTVDWYRREGLL
jgi:nucleoside-diphosphate-sugar epimerase